MTLEEKINAEIKAAMLSKNEPALRALRAVKSAILLAKTSGTSTQLTTDDELKILQKLVKQRKESVEIFLQQGRQDLAGTEQEEIAVIEKYLPEQLSEQEVRSELESLVKSLGASSPADTGKVMAVASKAFAGRADNKMVAQLLKQLLSN
ncbi:MAG: GatB/YqeY domain-containing protein [Bacteroidota bacterium]|jgi:uncharacterized protein YqeY